MGRPKVSEEDKKKRRREYAKANYHKHVEYRKEKILCECGALVTRAGIADHRKRSLHKNNLELKRRILEKYGIKTEECRVVR